MARRKIRKHVILGTLWNSVLQFFEALTSGQVSRYDMWFRPDLLKILKSGAEDSAPRNTRTTPTTNHSYNPNPNPNVPTRR